MTPSTNLADVVSLLEEIQPLRDELKRRAMIFDCECKERVADYLGKPFDHFHEISFRRWMRVKSAFYRRLEIGRKSQ